jgi:hypothetical protein
VIPVVAVTKTERRAVNQQEYAGISHDREEPAADRATSAMPHLRRKVRALAPVAKGHGSSRRERLQRPVMMVAQFYRSITWAALAFERGFPAITLDVHLQDRGATSRSIRGCRPRPAAQGPWRCPADAPVLVKESRLS